MKRLLFTLVIILSVNVMSAQVKVKTTKLDNGLKVVMCDFPDCFHSEFWVFDTFN